MPLSLTHSLTHARTHSLSSVSHPLPSLSSLVMVDGCPVVRHATLTIVDLAGNDRKPVAATASSPYTFAINLSLSKLRKVANELALAQTQALEYNNKNDDDDKDDKDEDDYNNNGGDDEDEEEDGYGHQALDYDDDDDDDDNRRRRSQRARANGGIMRVTAILHPLTHPPNHSPTRSLSHHFVTSFTPHLGRHHNRPSPAVVSYKESVLTFLLKDALSGDSRTLVVTTLSPLDRHRESSVSTMAFAGNHNNNYLYL